MPIRAPKSGLLGVINPQYKQQYRSDLKKALFARKHVLWRIGR